MLKIPDYTGECRKCGYDGLFAPMSAKDGNSQRGFRKYICPKCTHGVEINLAVYRRNLLDGRVIENALAHFFCLNPDLAPKSMGLKAENK